MTIDHDAMARALADPAAHRSRKDACKAFAAAIQSCGDVLWAFGLAEEPFRRALAMTLQMAGRLAAGAVAMLEGENWYAAGALVRQLIETEYLLFRFVSDRTEADRWLVATSAEIRSFFAPGAMRKRSGTQFRLEEYAAHCDHGGHPNPRAGFLLPEHAITDQMIPLGTFSWLWIDLAQHLLRVARLMESAVEAGDLSHVGIARQAISDATAALDQWKTDDVWASIQFKPPSRGKP